MSFFRKVNTTIQDEQVLCDALKDLGYKPEVHKEDVTVRGHGSETKKARVILRKEDIQDGGDIGFAKGKDGNYSVVGDEYVLRNKDHKLSEIASKVTQAYAVAKAKKIAKDSNLEFLGYKVINRNGQEFKQLQFRAL